MEMRITRHTRTIAIRIQCRRSARRTSRQVTKKKRVSSSKTSKWPVILKMATKTKALLLPRIIKLQP